MAITIHMARVQIGERKMKTRHLVIAMSVLLCPIATAHAFGQQPSHIAVGVGYPGINIGINMSSYPDLVQVPGYPVYYDPRADSNYFFYDGQFWVFYSDNWYASSWYNGPWQSVGYDDVPLFVLRVPVHYYRHPPAYFRSWRDDAPPRWGDRLGRDWEQRRSGWDHWDSHAVPPPAPLPVYQRQYSGDRYPRAPEQQHSIRSEHYRYQPQEPATQPRFQLRPQVQQQRARPEPSDKGHADQGTPPDKGRSKDEKRRDNERATEDRNSGQ
jgi:hypothetical protein